MKIGVLTVPFNNNFGGFLQAYALKNVLKNLGHQVIFINRRRDRRLGWKGIIKYILSKMGIYRSPEKILSVNTNKFIQCYLTPGTPYYYTSKALKKCLKYNFDYCIVGSDQVWRYKYAEDSIDDFFFSFLKDTKIPRMSYAASFGIDSLHEYPEEQKLICSRLLKEFSGISVREESGIALLEELGVEKMNVKAVLDPTLLLEKEYYYENLIKNYRNDVQSGKYIFNYILDENDQTNSISDIIEQTLNIKSVRLQAQTGDITKLKTIAPVEEWLSRIYYSDFVVTDSFHGTVFSILFNKPFIVIGNFSRGITRIQTLLKMFDLEERIIESLDDIKDSMINKTIDWNIINKTIEVKRLISLDFLTENLMTKDL